MSIRPMPPARGRPAACAAPVRAACAALILAACAAGGPIPPGHVSGRHMTTEHPPARFGDALEGALAYCLGNGLDLRHLGTDRLGEVTAVSRFECVARR